MKTDVAHTDQYTNIDHFYFPISDTQPVVQTYACLLLSGYALSVPASSCDRAPGDSATVVIQCPWRLAAMKPETLYLKAETHKWHQQFLQAVFLAGLKSLKNI